MSEKQTPPPWAVEKVNYDKGLVLVGREFIGSFWKFADAEVAVRAVNSHEALLEAAKIGLEQIKMAISDAGSCDHSVGLCVCPLIQDAERIQKAISQAEARP